MTKNKNNALKDEMKALFSQDTDFLKTILENTIQDILNTEMDIFWGPSTMSVRKQEEAIERVLTLGRLLQE